jgi:DNA mismatch repair protein MutS
LQVAKLAGIPVAVIQQAQRKLNDLEKDHHALQANTKDKPPTQLQLIPAHPIIQQLQQLDPSELSPREALSLIYDWMGMLKT